MYIPSSKSQASDWLRPMFSNVSSLDPETFLKGWSAVCYLHPGLHPDDCPKSVPSGRIVQPRSGLAYDAESGWPVALCAACAEAFSRFRSGQMTEDQMYPTDVLGVLVH